jgi:hypothetical protein
MAVFASLQHGLGQRAYGHGTGWCPCRPNFILLSDFIGPCLVLHPSQTGVKKSTAVKRSHGQNELRFWEAGLLRLIRIDKGGKVIDATILLLFGQDSARDQRRKRCIW